MAWPANSPDIKPIKNVWDICDSMNYRYQDETLIIFLFFRLRCRIQLFNRLHEESTLSKHTNMYVLAQFLVSAASFTIHA